MEFSGRREATRAPTVEKAKITTERTAVTRAEEVGALSEARRSVGGVATKVDAHTDHATRAATLALITPGPRLTSFALTSRRHSVPFPQGSAHPRNELFMGTYIAKFAELTFHETV
jgi:hypothetical protein